MSVKRIIRNLKEYGALKTLHIFNENKKNLSEARERRLQAAEVTREALLKTNAGAEALDKIDSVIAEMRRAGIRQTGKSLKRWNKEIKSAETKECRDLLRAWFIKDRIPAAYDENREKKVEDKIVFLQPRKGMSESYRYLFDKIRNDYPYEPVLCPIFRGVVSFAEHYLRAEEFAREAATAKAIMVHTSSPYLGYINIRPETKVIQLWHGCGVIKHLGLTAAAENPESKDLEYYKEFPEYNKYDLVTICSEEQRWVFEDFMGREKGDPVIQPVGMARTDEFFDNDFRESCYRKLYSIIPEAKGKKVILYAPTYRGRASKRVAPDKLDVSKFAEKLSDNFILIIKHHQTVKDLPEIPEEYRDKFAFDMTRGKGMSINELMTVADIMISDYSSVVFEYSLFERPIIFYMFDLEEYNDTRGMYYSYNELAECGPVFRENEEIVNYIDNIDKLFDKRKIRQFRKRFMSACDGHATERTMRYAISGELELADTRPEETGGTTSDENGVIVYLGNGASGNNYKAYFDEKSIEGEVFSGLGGVFNECALQYIGANAFDSIAINNAFTHEDEGAVFEGFILRKKTSEDKWIWYMEDGSWQSLGDGEWTPRRFYDGDKLPPAENKDPEVYVMEAHWRLQNGKSGDCGHRMFNNRFMAHALGEYKGKHYLNTKGAFLHNLNERGYRYFETDLTLTEDESLFIIHGFRKKDFKRYGIEYSAKFEHMTYSKTKALRICGEEPMDAREFYEFICGQPEEVVFQMDIQDFSPEVSCKKVRKMINAFDHNEDMLRRMNLQFYNEAQYRAIDSVYHFEVYQYNIRRDIDKLDQIIDFCLTNGICAVSLRASEATPENIRKIKNAGLFVLAYTIREDLIYANTVMSYGVDTLCTDHITEADLLAEEEILNYYPCYVLYISGEESGKTDENTNDGSYTVKECSFSHKGRTFTGWIAHVVRDDGLKFMLCDDGLYRTKNTVGPRERGKAPRLFIPGEKLPPIMVRKNDTIYMTAQWEVGKTGRKAAKMADYRKYMKRAIKKLRRGLVSGKRESLLRKASELTGSQNITTEERLRGAKEIAAYISGNKKLLTRDELLKLSTSLAHSVSVIQTETEVPEELKKVIGLLWDLEEDKKFKSDMKRYYIKELYPKIYADLSKDPVEDKVIMMESGNSPSPSSRHLAEVIEAQGKYNVIYIGLKIRAVPMSVFFENGTRLIKELATARALFLSTANELLSHLEVREETKVIQLWHGVGAFKHVGHSTVGNKHFGKTQKQWNEYDSYRNYYAVTIAGEGQRFVFKDAMHLEDSQILPIGISRTDVFFDPQYKHAAEEKLYSEFPQIRGKKIILYAPTFRGKVAEAKAPDRLDVQKMADSLSDEYVLLIKHHGLSHDIPPIPEGLENDFAFDMNSNKTLDIDELLAIADICITDYSSVAFEFAIMERPLIFFTYDLEEYIEERGLYFDFEKDAPGPLCRDTESIIEYIKGLDKSFDREKLLVFKKQYVEACDGHATERTIALI